MMDYARARAGMVEHQIARRGVRDPLVLEAMGRIPREAFVLPGWEEEAYEDQPLPIADRQTISQPFIVAYMIEAAELRPGDRALEIGTGSGYAAAVMATIAAQVYTIERHPGLADTARRRLLELGVNNVEIRVGDGTLGWSEAQPFDTIIVTAGGPKVPTDLREQLAIGGRLVIPVGESQHRQSLIRVVREDRADYREEELADVAFVPLIGEGGWNAA
ncbi:MAG: protein-L-isoaspartate(D-aspartate) O-methyltransferase [Methylobacteriaceae bacterium]|nr:protein-L-isoaspartate(D-aspartate) O-methyltransferase [Methylobacteriaceae bacterium]